MIQNIFHIFTWLGDFERVLIIGFTVIIFLFYKRLKKEAVILFCTVLIAKGASILLKHFFATTRPEIERWLTDASGYSFPSGHATVAMALYGAIFYFIWKHTKKVQEKYLGLIICTIMILGISFSRVILGVHWFSDVLGGWILGLLTLLGVIYILSKMKE